MANLNWIQEIEDNSDSWTDLEKIVYSDGEKIITSKWFNEPTPSEKFYLIIRSAYSNQNNITAYLRSLFIKIAETEIIEIPSEDVEFTNVILDPKIRVFVVEYRIIRPDLWEAKELSKLIYYIYILSCMLDYAFANCRAEGVTLANIVYNMFHEEVYFDTDRFFHSGIASLLNNLTDLRQTKKRETSFIYDGPRFLNDDFDGIGFVLQSREDLNEAISRVENLDATEITNEILIQYNKMRRNF